MKNNISDERRFLINRLGYIRNRANLSARELSQRLGNSIAYIAKFENGDFNMPSETLLNAIYICGSTPQEFFSDNIDSFSETNEIFSLYTNLSTQSKTTIKELLKNLK